MAYAEFYLTQGSGASNINGGGPRLGANDGPVYTSTDCDVDSGTPTVITDNSGSNWGYGGASEVEVGDWLCWDIAGVKEYRMVTDVTDIAIGAVTVHRSMTAGTGKSVYVGGAFQTFQGAVANIGSNCSASNWPASTDPPRLNVKHESGTAYSETTAVATTNFGTPTFSLPFVIEGYETTAGDQDWRTSEIRTVLDWGSATLHCVSPVSWVTFKNLVFSHSNTAATYVLYQSDATFLNCSIIGAGAFGLVYRFLGVMLRVDIQNIGTASGAIVVRLYSAGHMFRCTVDAGGYGLGIYVEGGTLGVHDTIIKNCANGIRLSNTQARCVRNTLVDCSGDAIQISSEAALDSLILNNLVVNCGGYGIARSGITGSYVLPHCGGNYFHGVTSGVMESELTTIQDNHLLSSDPLENRAGGDFRIKSTSDAYGVRQDLSSGLDADASFLDAGAIMRLRSASSGGGRRSRARIML